MVKMITRTITTIDVEIEYANMETKTVETTVITIGNCKDSQIPKKAKEAFERAQTGMQECKLLSAKPLKKVETILGMSEDDFIRMAKPVIRGNNGTAKPIEDCKPEESNEGGDSNGSVTTAESVPNPTTPEDKIAEKKARKLNK